MKTYQQPDFEVIKFEYEDIMSELPEVSGIPGTGGDWGFPDDQGNF